MEEGDGGEEGERGRSRGRGKGARIPSIFNPSPPHQRVPSPGLDPTAKRIEREA